VACTCKKECNKYDLTIAQCFVSNWAIIMIGPCGLLLVVPPPICCLSFSFMGGVEQEYITKLGCEKKGSHTEHCWRCFKVLTNVGQLLRKHPVINQVIIKLSNSCLWLCNNKIIIANYNCNNSIMV